MNWIKQNVTLTVIGAVTLVLAAVLAWLAADGYRKAGDAQEAYEKSANKLSRLYKGELYPNQANLEEKTGLATKLEQSTDDLHRELAARFTPGAAKDNATFGQRVQGRYQDLRRAWEEKDMTVPDDFFLGLERYRRSVSAPLAAVADLDYQLEAITEVIGGAVKLGITSIESFERQLVRNEDGNTEANPEEGGATPPLDRYRMTLRCVGPEDAVRALINQIASSEKHLFAFHALRLENEMQTGPEKEQVRDEVKPAPASGGGAPGPGDFGDLFGGVGGFIEPAPIEEQPEENLTDAERLMRERAGKAQPAGGDEEALLEPTFPEPGTQDAYRFLGGEKVLAHLEIDLVVIRPPAEEPVEDAD